MKKGWLIGSAQIFWIPFILRMVWGEKTLPGTVSYSFLGFLPESVVISWLITVVLTLFFVWLVARLVRFNTSRKMLRFVIVLFLITAPSTLYFATFVTPYLWALVLFCAALNVLHSSYRQYGLVFLLPLVFFDWVTIISVTVLGVAYLMYAGYRQQLWWMGLFIAFSVALQFFTPHGMFHVVHGFSSIFSDFGGLFGISLFAGLLAVLGIARSWVKKVELIPVYGVIVVLSVLCLWNVAFLLFLAPVLLIFAAYAFVYFWKRQWSLPFIRFLTLAVLIYGIAFSTIVYIPRVVSSPPSQVVLDSFLWLQSHPNYNDVVVLAPEDHGYWFSGTVVPFVTEHSSFAEVRVVEDIFSSRDFKRTEKLIRENSIELIWISDAMRDGAVWDADDEGLLFLLNDDRFIQVYDSDGIEMWRLG